ncbi:AraC family transcriptional regulator [Paenibacillus rigui]|uniref:AraC family transcriptional regulator n=1 Tax=Paenibacillus rigui TaxID=554312 RepID=A0A229UR88_9BACL|nr:AraC family transcriptional regulator [Paenibacillus rigui]OXM85409.1 AraC family transcriptional regulator [Paenibacillus rigui]
MQAANPLLYHTLAELKVKLIAAKFSVCTREWNRFDFVPEYNKFYFICEGTGWIRIDGKLYQPEPGQLFFAPAGALQSYSAAGGPPFTMYWCHFTSNIGFNPLFRSMGVPNITNVQDCEAILAHFRQLIDHRGQDHPSSLMKVQSALFEIMACYMDSALMESAIEVEPLSINKLMDTIRYIDANLDKEISIPELSQTAHFHPNYFIRFFKTHLGMSPMRYIQERRIEKAKELLGDFSLTINEVAHTTGFNDASHFSTSFKKHSGITPSDYRKLYQGGTKLVSRRK